MLEMKRIDKLLFFDNFHDYMFYDSFMNDDNNDNNNNKNKSFVKTRNSKSIDKKDITQSSITTNTKNKTIITSNDIRVQRNKEAFKLLNEKNVFEYHINLDIQIVLCNMQSIIVKGKRIIMILMMMMIIIILIMMIMIMMKIKMMTIIFHFYIISHSLIFRFIWGREFY